MAGVLGFSAGMQVVLDRAAAALAIARKVERVGLIEAQGRVLAAALLSDRDQPPFDRATRDGYAVRAADGGSSRRVVGMVRAGEAWSGEAIGSGEALEIMTGAPVPLGADAVVMVEHTTVAGDTLAIEAARDPAVGQNLVPRGAELRASDVALAAGVRLGSAEIAIAASIGAAQIAIYSQPGVAILATGDELVELTDVPAPAQIRNSNSYALAVMVEECGALARRFPIARDTREALKGALEAACANTELLLLSGGVSAGKYDLVEEMLGEIGAEFLFTGLRLQPGKPLVFGTLPRADGRRLPFFGLPGNPISTQVTFASFVAPLLRALGGQSEHAPRWVKAKLTDATAPRPELTRLLPAAIASGLNETTVRVVPWQGSGDLAANARANGYVLLPEGSKAFAAGDLVSVLLR